MSAPRRHYPAQPALAVSIAVFRDGKVLLATRTDAPYAQRYTLPGGLVETGETLEAAALRELREETGVLARICAFNRPVEHIQRDGAGRVERHYVILSFAAHWIAGEGETSAEAGEILWRSPDDLADLALTPNLAAVVAGAQKLVEAKP
ncbi:NUDIX hydrolase [Rhodoblastus sphagnicola]|uniref:NUDIX hydrolase n=1 Tax=Rhodoblastus sphagnicola TaxID=333368 RepID=A0A2S6N5K1_9HYPH|nr:NUDIX hydrolase [Rhodoblastus sphagnicola]